jgi:hypothetical protein
MPDGLAATIRVVVFSTYRNCLPVQITSARRNPVEAKTLNRTIGVAAPADDEARAAGRSIASAIRIARIENLTTDDA